MPENSNKLSKNQIIILTVLTLFVVLEVVLFMTGIIEFNGDAIKRNGDQNNQEEVSTTTDSDAPIPEMSSEVDEEATSTKAELEVGIEDEEGEETGSKVGLFNISATDDGFNPSQIVVNQGDVLQIKFSSESGYDFAIPAYGVHLADSEGQRQTSISASASGTFRIECRDSCPSDGAIYGELLVKPNQ